MIIDKMINVNTANDLSQVVNAHPMIIYVTGRRRERKGPEYTIMVNKAVEKPVVDAPKKPDNLAVIVYSECLCVCLAGRTVRI